MGFFNWLKSFSRKSSVNSQLDEFTEPNYEEKRPSTFDGVKEPRASFTVVGFDNDRIKVEFDWNEAFIEHIAKLGFVAETAEDSVQLFFYASSMRPTSLSQDVEDLSAPSARLMESGNRFVE